MRLQDRQPYQPVDHVHDQHRAFDDVTIAIQTIHSIHLLTALIATPEFSIYCQPYWCGTRLPNLPVPRANTRPQIRVLGMNNWAWLGTMMIAERRTYLVRTPLATRAPAN